MREDYKNVEAQLRLKDSEKKNRILLEKSPICTKIVDIDLNWQYLSYAGVKALGIDDVTKFYGKPYPFDIYPAPYCDEMRNSFMKVKETGGEVQNPCA